MSPALARLRNHSFITLLAIALAALSLGAAGCGDDPPDDPFATGATGATGDGGTTGGDGGGAATGDEEAAREAVEAYITALEDGDAEAACSLFSEAALENFENQAGAPCPQALGQVLNSVDLGNLTLVDIQVSGDTASATVESSDSAVGQIPIDLVLEDDGWKLAAPGMT